MNRGETTKAFARSVDRGLQFAIGIVIVVKTVVFGAEATTWHDATGLQSAMIVAILALVSIAGWHCVRGRAGVIALLCCSVAMVLSFWLPEATDAVAGAADSPITHLAEPLLLVVLLAESTRGGLRWIAVVVAIDTVYVGLRAGLGTHPDTGLWGIQEATFITGVSAAVYLAAHGLRRASERAEEALLAQARDVADLDESLGQAGRTFIHDELVPTLMAMSHNSDAARTLQSADRTLRRLKGPDTETTDSALASRIPQHAAHAGILVRVTTSGTARLGQLPARVDAAFDGAVGEALRNVGRHSGIDRAEVTIARRGRGLEVSITDAGRGFATKNAGVGITTSILERLASVGGTARIDSSPEGTVVRLRWRPPVFSTRNSAGPSRLELLRLATADPSSIARAVAVALALAYVSPAVLAAIRQPPSVPSLVGVAVLTILTAVTIQALRWRALPTWLYILVAVVPAAVLVATLPAVPVDDLGGLGSWIVEYAGLPALVAAWVVSVPVLIALLTPSAIVIGVIAVDSGVATAELPHLLLLQPLNATVVAVLAAMVRRAGRVVLRARTDDLFAAALPDRLAELLGREYATVCTHLTAHLAGLRDAMASERLAHSARDTLYLPGPHNADLRRELSALRARGTRVEAIFREIPDHTADLAMVLKTLTEVAWGPKADAELRLTTHRHRVLVVLIPGIVEAQIGELERRLPPMWGLTDEGDLTVMEWAAPDQPPQVLAMAPASSGRRLSR